MQCAFFTFAAVISVYEMGAAFKKKGINIFLPPLYLFATAYFVLYRLFGNIALYTLAVASLAALIGDRVFNKKRETDSVFYAFSILIYPLMLYVILMLLAEYNDYDISRILLLSSFAMPLMGDMLAYFGGKLFGKRKLAPDISPNKTVAGGIFGIVGGALGGYVVFLVQTFYPAGINMIALICLGAVCGTVGQIGDLFASTIKRWAGIKDFGKLFPGHGGVMDRLDSVLFCAPIVLCVYMWIAL